MEVEKQRQMAQFLTTEHFTLQGARSGTIAEANSQTSSFLSVVSAGIVALALVAQITQMGEIFFQFSLVLFPILIYLGFSTVTRLVHIMISDAVYTLAMNRIRQFYIQTMPETEQFLTLSAHDDARGVDHTRVRVFGYRWMVFSSNFGQVTVINSFLCAVFSGLLSYNFLRLAPAAAVLVGLAVFLILLIGQIRFGLMKDLKIHESTEVRFPTPLGESLYQDSP